MNTSVDAVRVHYTWDQPRGEATGQAALLAGRLRAIDPHPDHSAHLAADIVTTLTVARGSQVFYLSAHQRADRSNRTCREN